MLVPAGSVCADKVILKDGREFEGQVTESGDTVAVFTSEGMKVFQRGEIERIVPDLLKQADPQTRAAFMVVRREAAARESPAEAVELWKKYMAANPDGFLLPVAKEELATWQKAQAEGLIVWFGKTIKPEDRDRIKRKVYELIDGGIALLTSGEFSKAKVKLTRAEGLWPEHPTANFYLGDAWRKLRNPVQAAKRYDRVAKSLRTHVPALNNCACVCARVKDYRTAVTHLARALRREPKNDTLVNNAWEILHMLDVDKQGPGLRLDFYKVSRPDIKTLEQACFAQQERMQKEDKHRWGSRWVSEFDYKTYRQEQREADRRLKELQEKLKVLSAEIRRMANRLNTLVRLRNELLKHGSDAGLLTYHRAVKDLQEEIRDKKYEQAELLGDAKRIGKGRPEPKWSGTIVLLGIDSPVETLGGTMSEMPSIREAIFSRKAVLVAQDGTFLGRLTADRHDTESIWNPLGKHGTPYSELSIFDPSGRFGGLSSDESPWNPSAKRPPMIKFGEEQLLHLTANGEIKPGLTVEALVALMKQMP